MEFVDIPYHSTDHFRQLDVHTPFLVVPDVPKPLIVFIHGGAWRSEDKHDHKKLAHNLAEETGFPVAVPNYRLTPRDPPDDHHFRHPGHAEDILDALRFLINWQGPPGVGRLYDPNYLFLIGHSCSAHMLTSIFLDSSSISPTLTPPPRLLQAVKAIIMSEGIYDLDLLLASFPDYLEWFIRPTFGHRDSYAPFSTTNFKLFDKHIKWLVIHSKGDTLINPPQSQEMYHHLCDLYGDQSVTHVQRNTDKLDGEHNDILLGFDYVYIVKDFILHSSDINALSK